MQPSWDCTLSTCDATASQPGFKGAITPWRMTWGPGAFGRPQISVICRMEQAARLPCKEVQHRSLDQLNRDVNSCRCKQTLSLHDTSQVIANQGNPLSSSNSNLAVALRSALLFVTGRQRLTDFRCCDRVVLASKLDHCRMTWFARI